jgi:hypothetical protein
VAVVCASHQQMVISVIIITPEMPEATLKNIGFIGGKLLFYTIYLAFSKK